MCGVLLTSFFLLLSPLVAAQAVVVVVDGERGNDTTCLSALELITSNQTTSSIPCRTLDRALGNIETCSNACLSEVPSEERLRGVVFRLADGNHTLTDAACVVHGENISFEAVNNGRATLKCPIFPDMRSQFRNLAVCRTTGVRFTGMRFEHCGPYSANVFITNSTDIVFEDCVITNNSGAGVVAQFTDRVRLTNTHFLNNVNLQEPLPDVNETTIEELYNSITRGGSFTYFNQDTNDMEIIIENCSFVSNAPSKNDVSNSRPVLLKAHGHGGGVLIRVANVHDSHVIIENSRFEDNQAEVDGGAVYLSISRQLSGNTFIFRNNNFTNNVVELASGGAISVNSFNFTYNNTILIEDCFFLGNGGNAGGAFSLALYDSDSNSTEHPDVVSFTRCVFRSNTARNEGTAVGLFSLVHVDQVGFPVRFENCSFRNNTSLEESEDTSAIAAFRFPTIFHGINRFIANVGGGITLLNTRMQASGTLRFERNRAVFGGGMAMDDRCLLEVSPDTTVLFLNNQASESGGGIYVEFPPIRFVVDIFNRLCFLQYNDGTGVDIPPQEWMNVNISFIGNQARLSGAAIFASDMQQCGWLGSEHTTNSSIIFDPPEVLTNDSNYYPFQYTNNTLLPEGLNVSKLTNSHLATAPSMIHLMTPFSKVQPGETLLIDLLATDQVDNSREAVWSLEAPNQQANLDALSANNDSYPYNVPAVFNLPGYNGSSTSGGNEQSTMGSTSSSNEIVIDEDFASSFTLNFSLLRTLGSISTLDLAVNGCHPGYTLNQQTGECMCDTTDTAILRCDDNNRYIYLREGIWGGVQDNKLITARVQPGYVTCDSQGRLPGCRFKFDNQDAQCRSGRRGPLCGQCTSGHGVTLDLQSCTSTSCYIGVAMFTVLCVGVIIVSALMLLLDVKLPNELKGFVFYAQVVGLVYRPYVVVQTDSTTDALSIVLNLLGFSVPLPLCISQTISAHYIALFGYLSPLLVSITIALFVLGARNIRSLAHHSALNGITFLFLFFYKYIADTSFIFISCTDTDLGFVFQYDGSQRCLSAEFGVFFFLGLLLALFFVLPTPFIISYICIRRPLKFQQYADVLTNGLKVRHRWWGGWDIGRRLPFVIIAYFVVLARPSLVLFLMSLASLFVLLVHLFTKPFKKMYINVIEAAILLNLLMVTAAFLDPSNTPVPVWFSAILVLLPYVYAVCYLVYMIGSHIMKRMAKKKEAVDITKKTTVDTETTGGNGTEERATATMVTEGSTQTKETLSSDQELSSGNKKERQEVDAPPSRNTVGSPTSEEDYTLLREPLLDD